jgi:hypothetical protein
MDIGPRHQAVEDRMRQLLAEAGLRPPDEVAQLRRVVVFLWYDTKAFVIVDLDEMPLDGDPLDGLDVAQLAADVEGLPGFAETA